MRYVDVVSSARVLWKQQRSFLVLFFVISLAFSVLPVVQTIRRSEGPKDYRIWYSVGRAVLDDYALYPPHAPASPQQYFYPPAIATLFYAPLSLAGPLAMVMVLCAVSCLGHLLSILLSVRLATGRYTDARKELYLIPTLISLPFAWDIYFLGQLNLALLAIMLAGFVALEKRVYIAAGLLFGAAAATKAFPLTIIFYLLWRRFYKSAAVMLLTFAAILIVLPSPIRGFQRNIQELATWTEQMILRTNGTVLANQPERAYRYGNQALVSVVNRLTRPLVVGKPEDGNLTVNVISVPSSVAFALSAAIAGGLCLALVLAMRRSNAGNSLALECAIVLILVVAFSPKAGSYYYCWTIPGFAVAIAELMQASPGSSRRRWIIAGVVCSIAVLATALTQSFSRVAQGVGATLWGAVILAITLTAVLSQKRFAVGSQSTELANVDATRLRVADGRVAASQGFEP